MKGLFLILLLWGVSGCKYRGNKAAGTNIPGSWTVSGWYIRPEIEDQEGDRWESERKSGGLTNISANERAFKQSGTYLDGFDKYVATRQDLELFGMMAPAEREYNRAEYWVASLGNQVILDELHKRRGTRLLELPREDDYKEVYIFTGTGGPLVAISEVIYSLKSK